jgi:quinol monooxygenase YgiN
VIVVIGTIRCPVENLAALRAPMADVVAASLAEDGCIEYAYGEDMLEPGLIRISEVWRDQAALDRHFTQPHLDAWCTKRAALGVGDRRIKLYEAGDGREI